MLFGSPTWARTRDPMINSHLLYQLSYRGSIGKMNGLMGVDLLAYSVDLAG